MYHSRWRRIRTGFTLVELLLVMVVLTMIVAGAAATFVSGSKLGREAADRAEMLAARSISGAILSWEMRSADGGRDGFVAAVDSMEQRIFRGRAIVCSADSTRADVRYAGLRSPDPAKDSLLVLAGPGAERAVALTSAFAGGSTCLPAPGEQPFVLQPGAGLTAGDIALVFERGSYHLTAGALRYRRGAGGRQPFTADVFFDDSTDLSVAIHAPPATPPETAAVQLRLSTVTAARPGQASPPDVLRIPLLNLRSPLDSLASRP